MMYDMPKEIKSKTKVYKYIYVQDFFFLIIYGAVTMVISSMVYSMLLIPFYIFSAAMAVILILPSYYNPKRKNYTSILLMLHKDSGVNTDDFLLEEGEKDGNKLDN